MSPPQHLINYIFLFRVVHEKGDATRSVNLRISKGDSMGIKLRHKIAHNVFFLLLQCGCSGKQRRRVTVFAQSEKDQIMRVTLLIETGGQGVQSALIMGRSLLGRDFALNSKHLSGTRENEESFGRHPVIALRIFGGHAALIAKSHNPLRPTAIFQSQRLVDSTRGISATEGDSKTAMLFDCFLRRVRYE